MSTEMMTTLLRKGQTGSEILWILENLTSEETPSKDQKIRKFMAKYAMIEPTDQPIEF